LPLDWAMVGDFGEEALAIRDAMEEEFQFFARQKVPSTMVTRTIPLGVGKARHTCCRFIVP